MANDFISVQVLNERKLLRNLEELPDTVRGVLVEKVRGWTQDLHDEVIANIRERLKTKSGDLLEGVQMEIIQEGLRVEGRVYIAGVPYAQIQDQGGVTPPHIIRPRNAKVLAFLAASGHKVFATRVFHPGGQIAPKNFMKDAYRTVSPRVTRGLRYHLVEKLRRVGLRVK